MIAWIKKMIIRYQRILTFGVCGCCNTAVDYLVFALFYYLIGVGPFFSQALGIIAGSVNGYVLNSHFTFREGKGRTRGQIFQYVGIDVVLTVLSSWAVERLVGLGFNVWIVKIGLTAVITVIHYVVYKFLVFRISKEDDQKRREGHERP